MRKKIVCLTLALFTLAALAGCGGKTLSLDVNALGTGGALLPGMPPLCSEAEVRAAGMPMQEEVFYEGSDLASGLPLVVYGISPPDCNVEVLGHTLYNGTIEFLDEKLSTLNFHMQSVEDARAVESVLAEQYGAPVEMDNERATLLGWKLETDPPVLIQITLMKNANGEPENASLHIGYLWYEIAGQ